MVYREKQNPGNTTPAKSAPPPYSPQDPHESKRISSQTPWKAIEVTPSRMR
jgi:rRNA maturation protein Nop10